MKKHFFALFIFVCSISANAQFSKYFEPKTLRIDFVFAGNYDKQNVYLSGLKQEPVWGGSQKNLVDKFNYGEYRVVVTDTINNTIFAAGFSTLFQEWRTTDEAKHVQRAMTNTVWVPFPKEKIIVSILARNKDTNIFEPIFKTSVNPKSMQIMHDKPNNFAVSQIQYSGEPSQKVDLTFVAEGYTKDEMEKFRADVRRHVEYLFSMEPYKFRRNDFNIWVVESNSEDSGTDNPGENVWKNTAANTSFYTFGIERYLTAPEHKPVADLVWNVPHDQIYVLVNTNKYGGGGIYNFYCLGASDSRDCLPVFIHEFGHAFAGLGDEYFTSDVAYENFYNTKLEPWEPNVSSLVNFSEKWADLVGKDTPIPTPAEEKYQNDVVGVFEGAGYMAKGLYRPQYNCRMKTNTAKGFCAVCTRAINRMIDWYTE